MSDEITIRPAESVADYQACQTAQRLAWGINEEGYVVPVATMVGAQLHGGLVLGAFLPDGQAVGVSFAFLGRIEGRLCLYSQLTGIIPGYQDRGLGTRLKLAQRDFALKEGIEWIAWAFDPLQAGNARFNLDKLGAICRRYVENMYGPRTDALNAGTPTDRLIAEWAVSPRPRQALSKEAAARLPRVVASVEPGGPPTLDLAKLVDGPPRLLLEIPEDISRLRALDRSRADAWRQAVGRAFLAAFDAGYRATGFLRQNVEGQVRASYLLERG